MPIPGLRSPRDKVGGLVYFGRMLDKIRLHDAGRLPPGFNRGEGGKCSKEQIAIWNMFLAKRGWRDEASGGLEQKKAEAGLGRRRDIVTWFDLFDAEEGRKVRGVIE